MNLRMLTDTLAPHLGLLLAAFAGAAQAATNTPPSPVASNGAGAATRAPGAPRVVAILIYEGVELLDFAGPAEVFIVSDQQRAFRVVTVAPSREPLRTMGGVTIRADYTFEDAPAADILIVPGGEMRNVTPRGVAWIAKVAPRTEIVMSVCMGAFLLAEAGLLDGIEATTHHWGIDGLRRAAPRCTVVSGKRWVDSGHIITTAGVTAGIDAALHVVERLLGAPAARWTAGEWMEYAPRPAAGP